MKTKSLVIYIVICLIIIAGIAVWQAKGFRTELQYAPRYQIQLSNYTGIEISDIESIASEVLVDRRFFVQPVETFGNAVAIVSTSITEDERNTIVEKFNEKYSTELKNENVEIVIIPFTRIKDIIKPYIAPGIATLLLVTAYFLIRFRKLGCGKVLIKTLALPIVAELLMFSIISIARIPIGRLSVAFAIGLYMISILALTTIFEDKRNAYIAELQNNNQ